MGLERVAVAMQRVDIRAGVEAVYDVINELQNRDGWTIDMALAAMSMALGGAIAQRGGLLYLDRPLREAMPALVKGYEDARADVISS